MSVSKTENWFKQGQLWPRVAEDNLLVRKLLQRKAHRKIGKVEKQVEKALTRNLDIREAENFREEAVQLYREKSFRESLEKSEEALKAVETAEKLETANLVKLGARLKRQVQLFPENSERERKTLLKRAMHSIQERQGDFNQEQLVTLFNKAYDQVAEDTREKLRNDIQSIVESDTRVTRSKTVGNIEFYRLK